MLTYILVGLLIVLLFYYKSKSKHYWEIRNVAYEKSWPIIGKFGQALFRAKSFVDVVVDSYNQFPNLRYYGFYQLSRPVLLIRDIDLIKQICVKDFDHFSDRFVMFNGDDNSPMNKNLLALKGREWKEMRNTLSPAFTSSKMKAMYVFMVECAENLTNYYLKKTDDVVTIDMKEVSSRFANDVIASTAFGVKCDSFNNPTNDFYAMGQDLTNITVKQSMIALFIQLFPKFTELVGIKFMSEKKINYFRNIILDTIKAREKEGIVRPDLIHLLLEAKKGNLNHESGPQEKDTGFATAEESFTHNQSHKQLTDDDIVAQAFIFFFAGFETVSSATAFASLELAINVDVQEKLQNEIDSVLEDCKDGQVSYQTLLQMKYLDQVISEALRLWPPAFQFDRLCIKDYVIKPTNPDERPLLVERDVDCIFPVIGLHRDPKYFPKPLLFDPDRFSDQNKANITPGTYYPFGVGPRNCIGSRFALLEMKVFFFHLLSKFDLVVVEKTVVPIKISRSKFSLYPEGGFVMGLKARKATIL